jgi:hypothetical protein
MCFQLSYAQVIFFALSEQTKWRLVTCLRYRKIIALFKWDGQVSFYCGSDTSRFRVCRHFQLLQVPSVKGTGRFLASRVRLYCTARPGTVNTVPFLSSMKINPDDLLDGPYYEDLQWQCTGLFLVPSSTRLPSMLH